MKQKLDLVRQYCLIQMQVIADREGKAKKGDSRLQVTKRIFNPTVS